MNGSNEKNGKQKPEEDLPGYPHYPESEDILSGNSGMNRIESDVEGLPGINNPERTRTNSDTEINQNALEDPAGEEKVAGPNDITADDLVALGDPTLSMDGGEDEQLAERSIPLDATAADLDIPGSELDDASEALGSEDEENNFYSLGGDRHDT